MIFKPDFYLRGGHLDPFHGIFIFDILLIVMFQKPQNMGQHSMIDFYTFTSSLYMDANFLRHLSLKLKKKKGEKKEKGGIRYGNFAIQEKGHHLCDASNQTNEILYKCDAHFFLVEASKFKTQGCFHFMCVTKLPPAQLWAILLLESSIGV